MDTVHPPKEMCYFSFLEFPKIPLIVLLIETQRKNNFYTPGTKIKIVTEKISRKIKPDYYLVLPWHFKKEILIREKNIKKKGLNLYFPYQI